MDLDRLESKEPVKDKNPEGKQNLGKALGKDLGKDLDMEPGSAEGVREEAALPRDAYALLARANLLRMRGHWEDAAQNCMAALRLAPDSSSANSLLGDIYENQGRYDDAAQWYRMALDANPDSPADRLKLDRLRLREDSQRRQELPKQITPTAPRLASSTSTPRLTRDPEAALRFGTIAAAIALILVVSCAYWAAHHAPGFGMLSARGEAVVEAHPVVVPPQAGALPTDPDGSPVRDPSEQSLLTVLQGSRPLSRLSIAVYDVQVDPRSNRMIVTFGLPATPGLTQPEVARDALHVLQAAEAAQSAAAFTARCLLVTSSGKPAAVLAFVGDASQEAIATSTTAGAGLTDAQAGAVFSDAWWSSTADIRA